MNAPAPPDIVYRVRRTGRAPNDLADYAIAISEWQYLLTQLDPGECVSVHMVIVRVEHEHLVAYFEQRAIDSDHAR